MIILPGVAPSRATSGRVLSSGFDTPAVSVLLQRNSLTRRVPIARIESSIAWANGGTDSSRISGLRYREIFERVAGIARRGRSGTHFDRRPSLDQVGPSRRALPSADVESL